MKLSKGRIEDNIHIYNKSLLLWQDFKKILKNEFNKQKLVGGFDGLIDSWCLLSLQYVLTKKEQIHFSEDKLRPFLHREFLNLLSSGYFNVDYTKKLYRTESFVITEQKVFKYNRNIYDFEHIVKKLSHNNQYEKINLKIKVFRLNELENKKRLINVSKVLLKFFKRIFDNDDAIKINHFVLNSMPQIYLQKTGELEISGFNKILDENIISFIRTQYTTNDEDLLKLLNFFISKKGVSLYSITHGGNSDEIAYNSTYKIQDSLSKENLKPSDFIFPINLFRYTPNIFLPKKGIVLYFNHRRFQNTFMMGSETDEDYPKYIDNIIQTLIKINKKIKNEFLIMPPAEFDYANLMELSFHIKKSQIIENSSFRKKFYRRFFIPKLQIATYPGTVFLESICSGIPCLLYFDIERTLLSNEFKKIMDQLLEAKILHPNPDSLSRFFMEIYDFQKWWESDKTIKAIDSFKLIMKNCL